MWRWIVSVALVWLTLMAPTLSVQRTRRRSHLTWTPTGRSAHLTDIGSGRSSAPGTSLREWVGDAAGAAGFHNVYADPGTVEHFQRTGAFRDGAVIVRNCSGRRTGA